MDRGSAVPARLVNFFTNSGYTAERPVGTAAPLCGGRRGNAWKTSPAGASREGPRRMQRKDPGFSVVAAARALQANVSHAGPAAGAGYTLVGANHPARRCGLPARRMARHGALAVMCGTRVGHRRGVLRAGENDPAAMRPLAWMAGTSLLSVASHHAARGPIGESRSAVPACSARWPARAPPRCWSSARTARRRDASWACCSGPSA